MQFEVPQFIEVEDKIFGPLSLKQFIYVSGSLGATALVFFYSPSFLLFLLIAPFLLALGFGLAFVPVNKRPLSILLESVVLYFSKSRLYLWKREDRKPVGTPDSPTTTDYTPPPAKSRIASLARTLELESIQERPTDANRNK